MEASVVIINPDRGMVAAKSTGGGYVILELLGSGQIQIGDVVSHPDFTSMGSETYRNVTRRCDLSVYVQNFVNNLAHARKQCFLS